MSGLAINVDRIPLDLVFGPKITETRTLEAYYAEFKRYTLDNYIPLTSGKYDHSVDFNGDNRNDFYEFLQMKYRRHFFVSREIRQKAKMISDHLKMDAEQRAADIENLFGAFNRDIFLDLAKSESDQNVRYEMFRKLGIAEKELDIFDLLLEKSSFSSGYLESQIKYMRNNIRWVRNYYAPLLIKYGYLTQREFYSTLMEKGQLVYLLMTKTGLTCENFEDLLKLCKSMGVPKVGFQRLVRDRLIYVYESDRKKLRQYILTGKYESDNNSRPVFTWPISSDEQTQYSISIGTRKISVNNRGLLGLLESVLPAFPDEIGARLSCVKMTNLPDAHGGETGLEIRMRKMDYNTIMINEENLDLAPSIFIHELGHGSMVEIMRYNPSLMNDYANAAKWSSYTDSGITNVNSFAPFVWDLSYHYSPSHYGATDMWEDYATLFHSWVVQSVLLHDEIKYCPELGPKVAWLHDRVFTTYKDGSWRTRFYSTALSIGSNARIAYYDIDREVKSEEGELIEFMPVPQETLDQVRTALLVASVISFTNSQTNR